jgi:uncharacterized Ntn-hydrolase superfamily protein
LPASLIEPLWVEFTTLIGSADRPEFSATHPWGCHRRRIPDRVVFDHMIAALVHGSGYAVLATDGDALLDAVAKLGSAPAVLDEVVAATPDIDYRQLMVIDRGATAWFSGAHTLVVQASASGASVVAAGNLLATEAVPAAMVAAFDGAAGELEQRLVTALRAGLAAGGEAGPVRSAGLAVVADVPWRVTDLRVDWHDDPIGELERLVALWLPQRDNYQARALAPADSPSYGVPGDE